MTTSYDKLFKILTASGINLTFIRKRVREMAEDYGTRTGKPPKEVSYDISKIMMTRTIVKVGSIGAVTSSSSSIPGLGSVAAMLFTGAIDFTLVLKEQIELCYKISTAYDVDLDASELQAVSLAILGFSLTTGAATQLSEIAVKKAVDKMAKKYMSTGLEQSAKGVAKKLLPRLAGRISRYLPLISIPISASINVASTVAVGKQAIKYFSVWHNDRLFNDTPEGDSPPALPDESSNKPENGQGI